MTDLTPTKLGELKRLAEAATPGPWRTEPLVNGEIGIRADNHGYVVIVRAQGPNPARNAAQIANASLIAALNPPTVLALIAEVSRLTAELVGVRAERDRLDREIAKSAAPCQIEGCFFETLTKRADTLAAENEKLRTAVTAAKKLRAALSSGSNIAVERGFDAALAALSSGEQAP